MAAQREDLSRISVDSLQDWQRIKAHYTDAALATLGEELSGSHLASEKEALLKHINRFIDRTFEMTRLNLRVNGRNLEEVDMDELEEEPFDEGFDRHIWSLAEQSLKWDREIAEKRRRQPTEVQNLVEGLLDRQRDVDAELSREESDKESSDIAHQDASDATYDDVAQVAVKIHAIAEELNQAVSSQSERSQRVQMVAAEMKALKS